MPADDVRMPPVPTADVVVMAMPVLRVESAERSVRFYCGRLGFRQDWWHQASPEEPATVSVSRGGAGLILTERTDLGREGQVCVWTIELATLFAEWATRRTSRSSTARRRCPGVSPRWLSAIRTATASASPNPRGARHEPSTEFPSCARPSPPRRSPSSCRRAISSRRSIAQAPAAKPAEPGWVQLFNGKDLTGWVKVGQEQWTVEDGTIYGVGVTKEYGYLRTEQKYVDFDLTLRFKVEADGNSGVFFHSDFPPGSVDISQGLQFEIDRVLDHHTGGLYGDGRQWIVWPAPELETVIRPTDWNEMRMRVVGRRYSAT